MEYIHTVWHHMTTTVDREVKVLSETRVVSKVKITPLRLNIDDYISFIAAHSDTGGWATAYDGTYRWVTTFEDGEIDGRMHHYHHEVRKL